MSFDETNPTEQKPTAFCQNCGKPLDSSMMRVVGQSIFCEPCLAARIGVPTDDPSTPGATPNPYGYTSAGGANPWQVPAFSRSAPPNPGLAALLGFIPGVGAMYNEQYAKGVVHLIVFAMLVSLSHAAGFFGLLVMGWVAYMVIEAHHTARARRDGTPLPNPFGLNDLSERLGFGRNWGASVAPHWSNPVAAAPATAPSDPAGSAPVTEPWGAPIYAAPSWQTGDHIRQESADTAPFGSQTFMNQPLVNPVSGTRYTQGDTQPFNQPAGYYPPPVAPPYIHVQGAEAVAAQAAVRRSRFPAGAIWLIALGIVFLLATTGIFEGMVGESMVGFALIGLGVYVFLKRMFDSAFSLSADGASNYPLRVVRALRPSIWLFLIGLLTVLDRLNVAYFNHSWPWFIVVAGVMMLLERAASNSAAALPYTPYYPAVPVEPVTPVGTSITPSHPAPIMPQHPVDPNNVEGGI